MADRVVSLVWLLSSLSMPLFTLVCSKEETNVRSNRLKRRATQMKTNQLRASSAQSIQGSSSNWRQCCPEGKWRTCYENHETGAGEWKNAAFMSVLTLINMLTVHFKRRQNTEYAQCLKGQTTTTKSWVTAGRGEKMNVNKKSISDSCKRKKINVPDSCKRKKIMSATRGRR